MAIGLPWTIHTMLNMIMPIIGNNVPMTAPTMLTRLDIFIPKQFKKVNSQNKTMMVVNKKVREVFNMTNKVGLDEGIERMVFWAKRVGLRESKKFGDIEVIKNMPPSWQKLI